MSNEIDNKNTGTTENTDTTENTALPKELGSTSTPGINSSRKHENLQYGVVTLLDVLGWRGIWQREEPQDAIAKLRSLLTTLESELKRHRGNKHLQPTFSSTRFLNISDTLGIFTSIHEQKNLSEDERLATFNDSTIEILNLHGSLCSAALVQSIIKRIPLRGSTTIGRFYRNKKTYIGPAVDEVASFHETGDWIGVHLTPTAQFKAKQLHSSIWKNYYAPIKAMNRHQYKCVDWTLKWNETHGSNNPKEQLENAFYNAGPFTPSIAPKYINTLNFYNEMSKNHPKRPVRSGVKSKKRLRPLLIKFNAKS